MSEPSSIFRQEALEAHLTGQRSSGEPLRADSRWLRWAYWAIVILVVAGVAAVMLVRTDSTSTGPAVVNPDGTFSALIPAAVAPQLKDARSMRIESVGAATVDHVAPADAASLSRAHLPRPQQPSIILSGAVTSASSALARRGTAIRSRAVVVLRSESVLATIGRRVGRMLG